GEGKEVGPDLSEIGSKLSKEAMYVAILNPNAGISHNYETYEVVTLEGQIATGVLVSQSDEEVKLKNAEGIELTFPAGEVDELIKLKISIMPADLQKNLTVEELTNLVAYLTTLKKKQ
ncbi:MAG: dehydrogenase, partial [Pirellulales bacterium]